MRTILGIVACIVAFLLLAYVSSGTIAPTEEQSPSLQTEYSLANIEVVEAIEERARGLSGRTTLSDDYGMLFIFEESDLHGFWMKDMFVAIDIVWVNRDGTIAGITESVAPETYPEVFYPPSPVPFVLEVRAGLASELGFATGTPLSLPLGQ